VRTVLKIASLVFAVGLLGVMVYIGREEYGIARREGRRPLRAAVRALRVTIDSFVMGQ